MFTILTDEQLNQKLKDEKDCLYQLIEKHGLRDDRTIDKSRQIDLIVEEFNNRKHVR